MIFERGGWWYRKMDRIASPASVLDMSGQIVDGGSTHVNTRKWRQLADFWTPLSLSQISWFRSFRLLFGAPSPPTHAPYPFSVRAPLALVEVRMTVTWEAFPLHHHFPFRLGLRREHCDGGGEWASACLGSFNECPFESLTFRPSFLSLEVLGDSEECVGFMSFQVSLSWNQIHY